MLNILRKCEIVVNHSCMIMTWLKDFDLCRLASCQRMGKVEVELSLHDK